MELIVKRLIMRLCVFIVSCSLILVVLEVGNARTEITEDSESSSDESDDEVGMLETLKRLIKIEKLKG